ncbi:UDP-Glycosyltransferase/glycogen phosphorylase [Colletotrichum eremochloae]|nr:UDP-Glycosyltransferase/glycogen phosphorylase [Colletotrichum eremochloae]
MTVSGDPIASIEAAAAAAAANDGVSDGSKKRPYLVFCSAPASGHTYPILQIAAEMIQRGFEATCVTGQEFQPQIKRMGAELVALPPFPSPELLEERSKVPAGNARLMWDTKNIFIAWVPVHFPVLMQTLEKIRADRPDQQVIVVHESFFMGLTPMMWGAPLPKGYTTRPPVINVNVAPVMAASVDTGPFGPGLPPDSTESGRARNALLNSLFLGPGGPFDQLRQEYNAVVKSLGATREASADLFWSWQSSYDVTLQMSSPSLEYPRSDFPDVVKYAGCLPPKPIDPNYRYPEWWSEITAGTKKIVGVSQGTVVMEYTNLVIPTFQGLAHRDDIIVVAVLGAKGAALPEDVTVPANTRVVDFIPYDALLKYADVWVTNAGFGGFTHGVTNGVPMVLGGDSEDKPEVAMRGQWAGVAYNLKMGSPTPQQVADGVQEVLTNDKYKKRVMEVKKESDELKALDVVEKQIWEYAESS